ncbi:MAG: class I SAM-dependent methyltransferase [Anaerolineae bacterium]|nr:class I SAM-dependent methyltransferase [Anaerolineae bacterium]
MIARLRKRWFAAPAPTTLSSLSAYDKWAAAYPPDAHNALMQAEQAALLNLLPPLAGKTVLDLACGTGRYALLALERGATFALGVDNSPAMLRANALPLRALATTEALPLRNASFDGIICGLALGHLPRLDTSLREIARILKPGGWALISDFHPFIFLNGQRRTFTAPDGSTYAVEHYAHLYADYHRAAAEAGLRVDAVAEPRLGIDAGVRFANADTRAGTPVVIVYRMVK